jgi:hypothetical protein
MRKMKATYRIEKKKKMLQKISHLRRTGCEMDETPLRSGNTIS